VTKPLRKLLDWGKFGPLRLRAKSVADGVYAGAHRSPRRGAGIEFGGHRSYVQGDDLRFIDRHALMRHGQLLIREFETETDRDLRLIVDASASMSFQSGGAPAMKFAFAALIAAALAKIAVASGDRVALDFVAGERTLGLPATGGREAFERVIAALEAAEPGGEVHADLPALERAFARGARHGGRGGIVVFVSDLIDLPEGAVNALTALATRGRTLIAVQILDPAERDFRFEGPVRLRVLEGKASVETDATAVRAGYLAALEDLAAGWERRLVLRRGRLVRAATDQDPVDVVRRVLRAADGAPA
jgi:uncharacterized protein (DUF58 family)